MSGNVLPSLANLKHTVVESHAREEPSPLLVPPRPPPPQPPPGFELRLHVVPDDAALGTEPAWVVLEVFGMIASESRPAGRAPDTGSATIDMLAVIERNPLSWVANPFVRFKLSFEYNDDTQSIEVFATTQVTTPGVGGAQERRYFVRAMTDPTGQVYANLATHDLDGYYPPLSDEFPP